MSNLLTRIQQARKVRNEGAGMSTTDNTTILFYESEQAAEQSKFNYHVPTNEAVLGKVQAYCKRNDLEPPWKVVDGVE